MQNMLIERCHLRMQAAAHKIRCHRLPLELVRIVHQMFVDTFQHEALHHKYCLRFQVEVLRIVLAVHFRRDQMQTTTLAKI